MWRLALWHYGLPIALTALLRDPRGPHGPVVARAFRTLVRGEFTDPRWTGYPGSGRTSLWTLWWRLETLIALSRIPLAGSADILHWLPDATVVQRAHARERPLADPCRTAGWSTRSGSSGGTGRRSCWASCAPPACSASPPTCGAGRTSGSA